MAPLLNAIPKLFKARKEVATARNSATTLPSYSTLSLASATTFSSSSPVPPASSPLPSPSPHSPSEGLGQLSRSLPIMEPRAEAANTPAAAQIPREVLRNISRKPPRQEVTAALQQLRMKLLQDLQNMVGQRRARALYTTHINRSQYLLVHGDDARDAALAQELKRVLEEEGQVVEGPWSIRGGEIIIEAWQRLSSTAVAVVVLLSPALFQDLALCRCLAEMQYSHPDTIAPLFLQPTSPRDLPPDLIFLSRTGGRMVPKSCWDPHPFVKCLVESCQRFRHFCREIEVLNSLLDRLRDNADYVCPCGRC